MLSAHPFTSLFGCREKQNASLLTQKAWRGGGNLEVLAMSVLSASIGFSKSFVY